MRTKPGPSSKRRAPASEEQREAGARSTPQVPPHLLQSALAAGRGAEVATRAAVQHLQRTYGNQAVQRLLVQRATVQTTYGQWTTERYDPWQGDGSGPGEELDRRGCAMQLRFDPGDKVEANKIGLVQELKSWVGNAAEHAGNLGQIQPGQAARNVPGGQPAEHHRIDRPAGEDVPVYGAEIPDVYKGKANPPTMAQITISGHMHDTRIGSRRRGAGSRANIWTATPAKLLDTPNRRNAQTHSGQEFETTALALDGAQAGTYYGSVRWGWRTGGNPNAIELVPLSVVTQGAPSPTFMAAAQQWNAVETGPSAIQVPTNAVPVRVSVQYASKPGEDVFVVGNLPDLGDWNPDRAMPLSFRNGQEWEAVINVNGSQLPKQVEYKYLVKRQGQVRWEEGQNHRRQVAAGGPAPAFQDVWHEAHM